jgi:glyoxylase-like metal-dependent hydrolase (beta-lactamase superfamily II)
MIRPAACVLSIILAFPISGVAAEYDPSVAELTVVQLTDNIYKMQCVSGTYVNTLAFVGQDGILVVDTGYPQTADVLKQGIAKLGNGNVRIVINTHEHNDHTAGNDRFAEDAVIISHERVRKAYGGEYYALEATERPGIPQVVFEDELTVVFNGEEIRLRHYPGGHTMGDIVVYFTKSKIAFVGDMIFSGCFPFSDISIGGDLTLCLENTQKIIDDYPEGTSFVCGHGPDYSTEELRNYLDVGVTTRNVIEDEIEKGKTVDEILESGVLDKWKEWGEGVVSIEEWVACVHQQHLKDNNRLKTSICKPLTEMITEGSIEEAVEGYRQLHKSEPDAYDFSEGHLNDLGYVLLNRGMVKEAIEIFRLNVDAYPESGNVYDSLAEAYMIDGNKELAIEFYVKSLDKDPNNENARGMIERLRKTE